MWVDDVRGEFYSGVVLGSCGDGVLFLGDGNALESSKSEQDWGVGGRNLFSTLTTTKIKA